MRVELTVCLVVSVLSMTCAKPQAAEHATLKATLIESRRIWDKGNHNAFTDLIRFKGRWFCTFREGKGHVSKDGSIRVLTSTDGKDWTSAALIENPKADLRDPKLNVTPDGQLMLTGTDSWHGDEAVRRQTKVWFSKDGETWTEPREIADPNYWLWRVTWHKDTAWGVGYLVKGERFLRLYRSEDGKSFTTHVADMEAPGSPNETKILFNDDGSALCLLRRDPMVGMLGSAKPPYKEWTWQPLDKRIGGPDMIRLPRGKLVAVVRLYDGGARSSVCEIQPDAGRVIELLKLPSGGDTSYAGMVLHENLLWISYYASHEGKTSIYLAKVKFDLK